MRVVVLMLALALAGCKSELKLIPTPVVYQDAENDHFALTSSEDRSSLVSVFYATDRNPVESDDPEKSYGNQRGMVLRLGTAQVRIGNEDTSWDDLREMAAAGEQPPLRIAALEEIGPLWTTIPDRDRQAILAGWDPALRDDPQRQGAYEFARAVNKKLARSKVKDITIFVSGINVGFARPVKLTAEFAHYMGRDGVFIAYCWPAAGSIFAYNRDTETLPLTTRNLRELLIFLSDETDVRRIHVVGYSRGAAVLTGALHDIRLLHAMDDVDTIRSARKLGTAVYAGPDEDLMIFRSMFLDQVEDVVDAFVVYISPRDFALTLSKTMASGTERLGKPGSGITEQDLEELRAEMISAFVNVEYAQERAGAGSLGHTFWYDNPWVSSDLIAAMRYGLPPADRGLIRAEDGAMWTFPEDYPKVIRTIGKEQEAELAQSRR